MKKSTFEKYKRVIDEYLVNGENGAAAYRSVYPNVSDETSFASFSRMLRIDKVSEYLNTERQRLTNVSQIKKEDLVNRITSALDIDPSDFISLEEVEVIKDGSAVTLLVPTMKSLKDIPKSVRIMITSVKATSKGLELRFYSKEKAADQLINMLGFNAPVKSAVEHSLNGTSPISMADILAAKLARLEKEKE